MIALIQNWMEQAYRLAPAPPAGDFFVDREKMLAWIGKDHPLADSDEVLLFREDEDDISIGIFLAESLQAIAAQAAPQLSYHQLCNLIEGVSHLLLLIDRCRAGQETTLLELELQAEIDKFLFLRLAHSEDFRLHARDHLDTAANLKNLDSVRKTTYETARRLANRYCRHLEKTYMGSGSLSPLWEELRGFYRMTHWKKLHQLGNP